ncbi:MAG TPA: mismatch-specific DNA-glycosylase [Vicinamibacterales bacterium]|jgi:TDG/mug DNA glycosylase family protein|nr:mismatch-specific DNA-glycosylase [Vicinamibacterales bacterium]
MPRIISAAARRTGLRDTVLPPLRDRIQPGVEVLFVGINPGVRSALTGHHFAGFSNRFWKLLYQSRLVPERITFSDDDRLPEWGFGITNIVRRATPGIDTLLPHEYAGGRKRLLAKVRRFRPRVVALVGVTVFRAMFPEHKGPVALGRQAQTLGDSTVFVLPNTSGRNANFTYEEMLRAFRSLARLRKNRWGPPAGPAASGRGARLPPPAPRSPRSAGGVPRRSRSRAR